MLLPVFFLEYQKLPLGQKARWFYWFYPVHFISLIIKVAAVVLV
jgi:hypothetical protein